ncbi:hypothetical protein Tco_0873276 [Tanacetum coccineum]
MRGFLWSHGGLVKGKAKVRWDDVCGLKIQGGLGIKSLHTWNVALMSKHVWNLFSKKDSLWVKWINSYMLVDRRSCERNFWDIPILNDTCWGWRMILQCRDVLRSHIVSRIGNGCTGLSLNCKVSDLVQNGQWVRPESFLPNSGASSKIMRFGSAPNDLYQGLDFMAARPINKSIWCIIQRLVIGAVIYVLWQERNQRIFQGKSRSFDVVCGIIMELVMFRLLSLKIKNSKQALDAAEI